MLEREEICLEKDKLESKMNPRFLAEGVGALEDWVVWKGGKVMG